MLNDGKQTTISGFGELFDRFLKTRKLTGYSGEKEDFTHFFDPNYKTAKLRILKFDQTYENMPYDV